MTDDDFDKIDEDFASEFDFVDGKDAADSQSKGGISPPAPSQGTSPIVPIIIFLLILGGGYYGYKHFFGSKTTTSTEPMVVDNALPKTPLPELPATKNTPEPTVAPDQNQIDFSANQKDALEAALPAAKSFEEVQKQLHSTQQSQQATVPVEISSAIQNISDEMTVNVNNIKQLETTISALNTTVEQLNKTINAMDNRVLSLTETVDGLSQDLANVKKVMIDEDMDLASPGTVKFSNKKQPQTINSSSPSYSVHAIIPGRAWLKSSSGQIITVTEGDKIGDYGTVAVIDSANGLVRTSSGIILK